MAIPAALATQSTAGTGTAAWANSVKSLTDFLRDDERCPVTIARCSSNLTLTSSYQDVPGASITVTTPRASMKLVFTAAVLFDVTSPTTAAMDCDATLLVDGAAQGYPARFTVATGVADAAAAVASQWVVTVGTAASHTFKLQAKKTNGGTGVGLAVQDTTSLALVNWYSTT